MSVKMIYLVIVNGQLLIMKKQINVIKSYYDIKSFYKIMFKVQVVKYRILCKKKQRK